MSAKKFFLVDYEALPTVFKKVIKAKELIDSGSVKNTSQAIKECDLSRSAFYKYKDSVFKDDSKDTENAEIQAILLDRAGVFSALSNELFKNGANIITMNQTAPENGLATATIVLGTDSLAIPLNELINAIERVDGVISVKSV